MMKTTKSTMVAVVCVGMTGVYATARAQHHEGGGHEGGHEAPHVDERHNPPRAEPPKFVAHPPGIHPHPAGRGHATRVLAPRVVVYGNHHTWKHWAHPDFARPAYYWNWGAIHQVTAVAEDSYGDQYPVTENTFPGFGLVNMTAVEDDALDRCYQESGGDTSCYLASASHY